MVENRCPKAVRCADPFHVVKWATEALDEVRRQAWNTARGAVTRRRAGRATGQAKALKHARYALWKNPENLTERQQAKLAWIAKTDPRLHRAYLLKEGLRTIFSLDPAEASAALDKWVGWARRCRIDAFVTLQRRIVKHKDSILAAIEHGLSNGRIESVNTKIRLITRIAFGFATPEPLIALAMLSLGGHPPTLPGRHLIPTDQSGEPDYCARPACRRAFTRVIGPGRPQAFCSEVCRRAAEKELRQARSMLAHFEDLAAQLRVDIAAFGRGGLGLASEPTEAASSVTRQTAAAAVHRVSGVLAFLGENDEPLAQELRALHAAVSPVIVDHDA